MLIKQGKGYTGAALAWRRVEVAIPRDPDTGLEDRRGRILAVFPWKGGRTTGLISEVLVGALGSEDVISDLGMKSAKLGNGGIGGGIVRGGGGKEVGRR